MKTISTRRVIWLWLCLLLAGTVKPALAHDEGRTLQRGHVPIGAYYLTIWTVPAILRTGEVHLAMSLSDQSGQPAHTAQILVTLTSPERQAPPLSAPALSADGKHGGLRTALFNLQQPGRYRVAVTVTDEQGDGGMIDFDVAITQVPGIAKFLIYSQLLLAVSTGIWLLQKGFAIWFGRTNGIHKR